MIACPVCRSEMRVCIERGIELDICDSCNAVWLDSGELTKLSEIEENRRSAWTIPTNQECPQTTLHCRRCLDTLLVKVAIKSHTLLGCCSCNGLYIDSGTLDSITIADDEEGGELLLKSVALEGILESLSVLLFW